MFSPFVYGFVPLKRWYFRGTKQVSFVVFLNNFFE